MSKQLIKESRMHGKHVKVILIYETKDVKDSATALIQLLSNLTMRERGVQQPSVQDITEIFAPKQILEWTVMATEYILHEHPELIVTDPFAVEIKLQKLSQNIGAIYHWQISSPPCAFLTVNLDFLSRTYQECYIKSKGDKGDAAQDMTNICAITINHELRHHSEFSRTQCSMMKFAEILEQKGYAIGLVMVIGALGGVRNEAVTTFEEKMLSGKLYANTKSIKDLMEMCDKPPKNAGDFQKTALSGGMHEMGCMIAYILAMDHIKSKNKALAEQVNAEVKKTIKQYLDNEPWTYFSPIARDPKMLKSTVSYMTALDEQEFLRAYEKACKRLGIPDKARLLTWTKYRKTMNKAYRSYKDEVEEAGFQIPIGTDMDNPEEFMKAMQEALKNTGLTLVMK